MTQIPEWWLGLSTVLMALQCLFFFAMAAAVFQLIKAVKQITPKVEALADRVQSIGIKVDGLTENVKDTMDTLGVRAKNVAGSAEQIAHTTARNYEKYSPYVVGILSALKIVKAVQEFRDAQSAGKVAKDIPPQQVVPKAHADVDKRTHKKDT
ncbi:MAG: hypothetical protein ACHQ50_09645 [Fimbriimonadales bacterium]